MKETKVNTGGPAFSIHWENHHQGITMRDYFAAKVLHASITLDTNYSLLPIAHARWAYDVADAMIEARTK